MGGRGNGGSSRRGGVVEVILVRVAWVVEVMVLAVAGVVW